MPGSIIVLSRCSLQIIDWLVAALLSLVDVQYPERNEIRMGLPIKLIKTSYPFKVPEMRCTLKTFKFQSLPMLHIEGH